MTETSMRGNLTEKQLILKHIERINQQSAKLEGSDDPGKAELWCIRYKEMVDELYSMVKPVMTEEEIKELDEGVQDFVDNENLFKKNAGDIRKAGRKKKELILECITEKGLIYNNKGATR